MTFAQTQRLMTMLGMNYAAFLPKDVRETALKTNIWAQELKPIDAEDAEAAFHMTIQNCEYPPALATFLSYCGAAKAFRQGTEQRLLEVDNTPKYTADMDRVNRIMADLMKELA